MFWNDGTNTMAPLVLFGALAAVEWGFFFISYFVIRRVNFELESLALFLTGIGVMMLIRQSERSAYVQLVAAAIGMIFFCVIIKLIEDPDKVNKLRLPAMICAVGLLGVTIVFGKITKRRRQLDLYRLVFISAVRACKDYFHLYRRKFA